jgi:hypothetical protein
MEIQGKCKVREVGMLQYKENPGLLHANLWKIIQNIYD